MDGVLIFFEAEHLDNSTIFKQICYTHFKTIFFLNVGFFPLL